MYKIYTNFRKYIKIDEILLLIVNIPEYCKYDKVADFGKYTKNT